MDKRQIGILVAMTEKKLIYIFAIVAAFVLGSIISPNIVNAEHIDFCEQPGAIEEEDSNGKWANIWHAICSLQNQEDMVNDADPDPSNEDQTLFSNGGDVELSPTAAGDGGGNVSCAEITGGASLCDGEDAVDDADNDSTNELQNLVTQTTTFTVTLSPLEGDTLQANCPAGTVITGGGYFMNALAIVNGVRIVESVNPSGTDSWRITAIYDAPAGPGGNGAENEVTVQAVCASLIP